MDRIINISLAKRTVPTRLDVVQYSTAPDIVFIPEDFELAGTEAYLYIKKPSGLKVYSGCQIEVDRIRMTPTTQAFAEIGENVGQLEILKDGRIAFSFPIFITVIENIIDDSAVESQDEFTALQQALSTVSQYDSRIGAVESGLSSAESNISTAQSDISTAQSDISTLQTDVSTLQTDVQGAQGDISSIISDLYYQPGETVSMNGIVGNGYSTATSGTYYFYFTLPKKLPQGKTLTASACVTSIRSPGGRATSNADNLANLGIISTQSTGQLVLAFNSITTNFVANNPANIVVHTLTFTIEE